MVTHYAVIHFSGDPAGEHADPDLHGSGPRLELIAAGGESSCWDAIARWTEKHPLRMWETAEVLARDAVLVTAQAARAAAYLETPDAD